ncbi:MAG: chromosome segregation protein SMC [Polyangiaceae bacterium]
MHIKKLEIAGFKSFVDRTVIHFDHDVIGVVGPNGCGKSNIVDAIRWCMGEQSAKHLRGKSMEDVIFNGSESRGPHGLAEVTITFDNNDPAYAELLPPEYRDYPEIAVTRRLFRDGTSEYLINKTVMRLRDITELFLGTGVGTKAYSIVEQGRIGQIVSARPEDRRLFIEEAAGITKYKQRKRQAERKMDLTRQNLLRVTDIVSEIDRTRASLKRQVAKAERYIAYRAELEDLFLHDASHKYLELAVTERVERERWDSASREVEVARQRLQEGETQLDAARHEALRIEERADEGSKLAFEADNEVTSTTAEIERCRDRLQHLEARLVQARGELDEVQARNAEQNSERDELLQRLEYLSQDEHARIADAQAEDDSLAQLRTEEASALAEVQQLRDRVARTAAEVAAVHERLEAQVQRLAEAHARRDRLSSERDSLQGELSSALARQSALERSVAELAEGKRLTAAERANLETEMNDLSSHQLESERGVDTLKNELGLKRNRLRALEDLHRRLEGVGAGPRALLQTGNPAVLGLVADRIEAPAHLTSALAGLLAGRLQYVVVKNLDSGIELLSEMGRAERGRASILAQRPPYVAGGNAHRLTEDSRVVGLLVDQLRFAPEDEQLVRSLVGDAAIVETAQDALAVSRAFPGATAVALDGTVVDKDGVVSGGSGDDVASAMVEQKREMRTLAEEVAELDARCAAAVAAHNQLRARISELSTSLERARQGAHEGELAHMNAEKDLARVADDIARAQTRLTHLDQELGEVAELIQSATTAETEAQNRQSVLETELEHARHALVKAEALATSWNDRVAAQATLVTERKVRLAQVREQMDAARGSLERVEGALRDLSARSQRLDEEMTDTARQSGETAARLLALHEQRKHGLAHAKEAHEELNQARALLEQVRFALGTREAELKALRDQLSAADESARRAEMALQRIDLEREHLLANVRDRFRGLDLRRVIGDYHARPTPDDEQRRRIDELIQLIDRMGPVNLDARSEWEDAEKRFQDLSKQKIDIEQALADLERAIKHMNKESRRRFRETFDTVNELFKKTFTRNFRGGRAELVLTDPEDLLASGVDIVAQPPGKKLGNIELMSGGEKALTAVSLIFAIFQHRPSPFCVLDEVDAPLDEANVARYNEAIRAMTANSQFILITHVKKTMQSVDVLYGVTMGEPGVSRIVSVKVNEDAVARSDARANALGSSPPPAPAETESDDSATQVA